MSALIILGLGALFFADFGRGYYADLFRAWIVKTFGRYMIRGAEAFAAFMVSTPTDLRRCADLGLSTCSQSRCGCSYFCGDIRRHGPKV